MSHHPADGDQSSGADAAPDARAAAAPPRASDEEPAPAPTAEAPDGPPAMGRRPGRRAYLVELVALAAGAALLLWSYGQRWATAVVDDPGLPRLSVEVSGRDWFPLAAASALVALAGVAGILATGRWGRAVTGAVLVAAGVAAVVPAVGVARGSTAGIAAVVAPVVGQQVDVVVTTTAWWCPAALAGLVVATCGLAAVLLGGRWPRLGSRYERQAAGPSRSVVRDRTNADTWAAIDRGEDPTA